MTGDIIYISKENWKCGLQEYKDSDNRYRHYGIDIGNGYVVHYLNYDYNGNRVSKVIKSTIYEFSMGEQIRKCLRTSYKYNKFEIVSRAISKINSSFDGYNCYKNNCEHFVRWCVTGERYCIDINSFLSFKKNSNMKHFMNL